MLSWTGFVLGYVVHIIMGMDRSSFIDLLNWPTISFPQFEQQFWLSRCQPVMLGG